MSYRWGLPKSRRDVTSQSPLRWYIRDLNKRQAARMHCAHSAPLAPFLFVRRWSRRFFKQGELNFPFHRIDAVDQHA